MHMTGQCQTVVVMRIGIIADTHDRRGTVEAAVDRFNQEGVEYVLHAGDYVAPFVVDWLSSLKCPLVGVFGNNDGDRNLLTERFNKHENLDIRGDFARLELDGVEIALIHGHQRELLSVLIDTQGFDFVVHGHSHRGGCTQEGRTRIINPGEACGYLTGCPTVAVLETETGRSEMVVLE